MDKRLFKTARPTASLQQGRADWYRIENKANASTAEVYIYDEIGYFGVTAADFAKDVNSIKASQIDVHINSPGGEIFDGITIYNTLKNHPAYVTSVVDGLAASAASFIAMAGDKVVMAKNAQMMVHDGHGLCVGNAADMLALADLLEKSSDNIASIYADKTGKPKDEWRSAMKKETWYNADEAVAAGLADEIQGSSSSAKNDWDLSIFNYQSRTEAPAPVASLRTTEPIVPTTFTWDFSEFREAIKEAVK